MNCIGRERKGSRERERATVVVLSLKSFAHLSLSCPIDEEDRCNDVCLSRLHFFLIGQSLIKYLCQHSLLFSHHHHLVHPAGAKWWYCPRHFSHIAVKMSFILIQIWSNGIESNSERNRLFKQKQQADFSHLIVMKDWIEMKQSSSSSPNNNRINQVLILFTHVSPFSLLFPPPFIRSSTIRLSDLWC